MASDESSNSSSERYSWRRPQWIVPGQVAAKDERGMIFARIAEYVLVAVFVLSLAVYDWIRAWLEQPPQPLVMTIFAALVAFYAVGRIWLLMPSLRAVRAREQGEARLRGALRQIGERGYYLLDPPGQPEGSLAGAILVGPAGVFALTARSFSQAGRRGDRMDHLGRDTLRIGQRDAMADPLGQARKAADWAGRLLDGFGLGSEPVQPILICPGWEMGKRPDSDHERDVWVVNEETLVSEISQRARRLEPSRVQEICEAVGGLS